MRFNVRKVSDRDTPLVMVSIGHVDVYVSYTTAVAYVVRKHRPDGDCMFGFRYPTRTTAKHMSEIERDAGMHISYIPQDDFERRLQKELDLIGKE